jgi:hypothetical protein
VSPEVFLSTLSSAIRGIEPPLFSALGKICTYDPGLVLPTTWASHVSVCVCVCVCVLQVGVPVAREGYDTCRLEFKLIVLTLRELITVSEAMVYEQRNVCLCQTYQRRRPQSKIYS